jgi:hypothetical protein
MQSLSRASSEISSCFYFNVASCAAWCRTPSLPSPLWEASRRGREVTSRKIQWIILIAHLLFYCWRTNVKYIPLAHDWCASDMYVTAGALDWCVSGTHLPLALPGAPVRKKCTRRGVNVGRKEWRQKWKGRRSDMASNCVIERASLHTCRFCPTACCGPSQPRGTNNILGCPDPYMFGVLVFFLNEENPGFCIMWCTRPFIAEILGLNCKHEQTKYRSQTLQLVDTRINHLNHDKKQTATQEVNLLVSRQPAWV